MNNETKCCCACSCQKAARPPRNEKLWLGSVLAGLVLWALLYAQLSSFSHGVVELFPFELSPRLHEALAFFLYDAPKVLLLVTLIIFLMGIVRSFFSSERTRALLTGKREGLGNVAAACLGVVTPFCSCSAVPLFIGFVSAGIPLGVTFSFLIAAPMVNEIALGLLFGLVGWKVALIYLIFGLGVAIVAGWVMGRFHLEGWLEGWVRQARTEPPRPMEGKLLPSERIKMGLEAARDIVSKVWLWMIAGVAVGAYIHGYVPTELLAKVMGAGSWWSVPGAVLLGVPMYSNAAGMIPVVEALLGKGAALGTALAFMMSVTALSLPEMIILRRVFTLRLIAVFISVVTAGILAVGFLFNALLG